jgi:hypothetical protein
VLADKSVAKVREIFGTLNESRIREIFFWKYGQQFARRSGTIYRHLEK